MKRKQEKPAYDRIAAGERLRCRRLELGWSRELVAERLGVVNKYYADIERGTCGMSVETLINLSRLYGVSLDTLIYGEKEKQSPVSQGEQLMRGLDRMPQVVQDYCLRMLWLFVAVPIRHEVATVELSYPITWTLASALFIVYYLKGGWMQRCAEKWEKKQKA